LGVVVGVAAAAHADLEAVGFEQIGVIARRVPHAAIGVMHKTSCWPACFERHLQGFDGQRRLQRAAQRPADDFARERIQDYRQIDNSVSSRT